MKVRKIGVLIKCLYLGNTRVRLARGIHHTDRIAYFVMKKQ